MGKEWEKGNAIDTKENFFVVVVYEIRSIENKRRINLVTIDSIFNQIS